MHPRVLSSHPRLAPLPTRISLPVPIQYYQVPEAAEQVALVPPPALGLTRSAPVCLEVAAE